eukprot:650947-Pyramimonas_sp.AAC.1
MQRWVCPCGMPKRICGIAYASDIRLSVSFPKVFQRTVVVTTVARKGPSNRSSTRGKLVRKSRG